jgi:concanavalin A-like lectin/glucanase superfamily protein
VTRVLIHTTGDRAHDETHRRFAAAIDDLSNQAAKVVQGPPGPPGPPGPAGGGGVSPGGVNVVNLLPPPTSGNQGTLYLLAANDMEDATAESLNSVSHYYPMSEATGTTLNDLVNAVNGTLAAGGTFGSTGGSASGATAILYDGNAGLAHVGAAFGSPIFPTADADWSVSLAFFDTLTSAANRTFFAMNGTTIEFYSNNNAFFIAPDNVGPTGGWSLNAWHMLGVSYDHTLHQLRVYLDGALLGSPVSTNLSTHFGSGGDHILNAASGELGLHGSIEKVGVFTNVLGANDFNSLYMAFVSNADTLWLSRVSTDRTINEMRQVSVP